MKIIVAGSRTFTDARYLEVTLIDLFSEPDVDVTEIVSGCAHGADKLGEAFARLHGFPIKYFPADWNRHGKTAGFLRNIAMAEYADGLAAFWNGHSRGTQHMITAMKERKKPVWIFTP